LEGTAPNPWKNRVNVVKTFIKMKRKGFEDSRAVRVGAKNIFSAMVIPIFKFLIKK